MHGGRRWREYTCAQCKGEFVSDWTEEDARAEYEKEFPDSSSRGVPTSQVCEDCYQIMEAKYPHILYEIEVATENKEPTDD